MQQEQEGAAAEAVSPQAGPRHGGTHAQTPLPLKPELHVPWPAQGLEAPPGQAATPKALQQKFVKNPGVLNHREFASYAGRRFPSSP
jgi:hypothetical protein